MPYTTLDPLSRQLTIVIGLAVVGFMAFGLALSFYRNALFEQTLQSIREQNNALQAKIEDGYRQLEYHQSIQYKDKYAKENLSLVQPGENVLIITEKQQVVSLEEANDTGAATEHQEALYQELLRQMPTLEHWKLYLFHKEKIEQLKYAL